MNIHPSPPPSAFFSKREFGTRNRLTRSTRICSRFGGKYFPKMASDEIEVMDIDSDEKPTTSKLETDKPRSPASKRKGFQLPW